MTSRLDRLFILLESGTSAVTRKAAAKQIGDVQKLHPHELHNLLNRLIVHLHNSNWDTRVAASQAVQAILENVPLWDPSSSVYKNIKIEDEGIESFEINEEELLTFAKFDINSILKNSTLLMGSEGTEFDVQDDCDNAVDQKEKLSRQLNNFNKKYRLNSEINIMAEIVSLEDMKVHKSEDLNTTAIQSTITIKSPNDVKIINSDNARLMPAQEMSQLELKNNNSDTSLSLSCREMNRARRKARQSTSTNNVSTPSPSISKTNANSNGFNFEDTKPSCKKIKLAEIKVETPPIIVTSNDPVPDVTGSWDADVYQWPFKSFYARLYLDLFNPRWETRHGSATALRELIKLHSASAGKSIYLSDEEMENKHYLWLEDAGLRLLSVLALDRFGDYVSDQVVAPVRETCAQVLGTILKEMSAEQVKHVVDILLNYIKQQEWEVRHGGLLGLKYMLVVREDLIQTYLPFIIKDILEGLYDKVDDVGAVAASTLIPISSHLPKLLNFEQVSHIVKVLWDLLLDQDELASASNSFMGLLASILCLPNGFKWIQMGTISILIPRLWPFLSHSTSSVRKSTLQTLKTLTETNKMENEDENNIEIFDKSVSLQSNCVQDWSPQLLQEAMRHLYQRVLVEHVEEIQLLVEDVWNNLIKNANLTALLHASCPYVASWLCLAMQPARLAFDPATLIFARLLTNSLKDKPKAFDCLDTNNSNSSSAPLQKLFLGGTETIPADVRDKNVVRARYKACRMLGALSKYLVLPAPGVIYTDDIESPIDCYTKVLMGYLHSRSALQRLISSMVIAFWAMGDPSIRPGPVQLQSKLKQCLMENVYYDEVAVLFTRLLQESRDFIATLKQHKICLKDFEHCKVLTLDQIQILINETEIIKQNYQLKPKIAEMLEERRKGLKTSLAVTSYEQNCLNVSTQAVISSATVSLNALPDKLNPVVKPLMESLKREECGILQKSSAHFLVCLLDQITSRNPCPNGKIINNLSVLLSSDEEYTPKIFISNKCFNDYVKLNISEGADNPFHGILTLSNQNKNKETSNGSSTASSSSTASNRMRPGRPPTDFDDKDMDDATSKSTRIQRLGATYAITEICSYFKENLRVKVPILWELMISSIKDKVDEEFITRLHNEVIDENETNKLMISLQLIEIVVPHLDKSLHDDMFELLPELCTLLLHPLKMIRHMVSRCLATLAHINPSTVMVIVINKMIPTLSQIESVINRQGSVEAIACIVNKLQVEIVPYVVLLVVPLLGRMSDPDQSVRLMSTHSFASLIQLMPLDGISNDAGDLSDDLKIRKLKDKEFLEYLFCPKTIPDFKIPVPINAVLRSYQQAGINWLWFLNKYKLHGILCDDMGLGKTLQTICILAGDHYYRDLDKLAPLPSLVICPPTLTGHWVYEINKFLPNKHLNPLHYVGLPVDRERLRQKIKHHNLVVASYDIVRKDIDFFGKIHWNYCVLDEGHIIKNGKTKNSKAIKQLIVNHRLILSGTPIQNNVLELWSLFDFLMPGFLGSERQFLTRFSRPILASQESKSSLKDQEAGALAMETLHRQVLPFLLRRVKEDVLTDLPPKITQDLLCELSPLQERLYEDFSKANLNLEIRDCLEKIDGQTVSKKTNVFQALRYLQNVCNHPKLVLSPSHPEYKNILMGLLKSNSNLDDIAHSAKLPALKQLLLDCGIGTDDDMSINQHRALIFCQLKAMLNIIENDLLKKHLPSVSYLRLDGSVPGSSRHQIVTKFNNDPSIDVLLLTTQVGGLGLNLTGADTVIFVEHDWNPMKDLQAMDRAHRIGQKKVVNVYRLITRKSLEEKIMGLQKFKILTANTIVSSENASMETMGTDQLLDLFNFSDIQDKNENSNSTSSSASVKQVLETLPELWEEKQYEEEYDLTQFVQNLKK